MVLLLLVLLLLVVMTDHVVAMMTVMGVDGCEGNSHVRVNVFQQKRLDVLPHLKK